MGVVLPACVWGGSGPVRFWRASWEEYFRSGKYQKLWDNEMIEGVSWLVTNTIARHSSRLELPGCKRGRKGMKKSNKNQSIMGVAWPVCVWGGVALAEIWRLWDFFPQLIIKATTSISSTFNSSIYFLIWGASKYNLCCTILIEVQQRPYKEEKDMTWRIQKWSQSQKYFI